MKKIALFSLCLFMVTSNTQAKNKYEPDCKVSGFDNQTTCFIKPYGVWVDNKRTASSFVSFGGTWTSAVPDSMGLAIFYGDASTNIKSVSFNIDGDISEFKVDILSNKVSRQGSLANTTSLVVVPVDYVRQLVKSKNVKYRVSTITDGYTEGSFYSEKGAASEPITTLKALLEKADAKQPNKGGAQ